MDNLNPASSTLSPLPLVLTQGLAAVTTFGFLSFVCSTSLFLWLSYRLVTWRFKTPSNIPANQFLVLIYHLVIADIQQSMAFLLNIQALRNDALSVGTTTCWAQGWFISTGDLASSVFIFAIAVHTFMAVVKDYKLPTIGFYCAITALWCFVYIMAVIGVTMHPTDLYVRAGAWCWINISYQEERLWLHYFWVFFAMFGTTTIYTTIYIVLYRRSRSTSNSNGSNPTAQPHSALPLMILYPSIYTICTIPLAAGRLASMAGKDPSLAYFCVAGSMISCNGWLDVVLYGLTRRGIVFNGDPAGTDLGVDTFIFGSKGGGRNMGTTTTIQALNTLGDPERRDSNEGGPGRRLKSRAARAKLHSGDSTENLYGISKSGAGMGLGMGMGGIKTETTVHVSVHTDRTADTDTDGDEFEMHGLSGVRRLDSHKKSQEWESGSG